jgi:GT2 family glycosyltransferase
VVANDLQECPAALQGSAISWILPPRNLGFDGGCSLGAQHPAAKFAFLNADVILKPTTVTICLDALDLPDVRQGANPR